MSFRGTTIAWRSEKSESHPLTNWWKQVNSQQPLHWGPQSCLPRKRLKAAECGFWDTVTVTFENRNQTNHGLCFFLICVVHIWTGSKLLSSCSAFAIASHAITLLWWYLFVYVHSRGGFRRRKTRKRGFYADLGFVFADLFVFVLGLRLFQLVRRLKFHWVNLICRTDSCVDWIYVFLETLYYSWSPTVLFTAVGHLPGENQQLPIAVLAPVHTPSPMHDTRASVDCAQPSTHMVVFQHLHSSFVSTCHRFSCFADI